MKTTEILHKNAWTSHGCNPIHLSFNLNPKDKKQ